MGKIICGFNTIVIVFSTKYGILQWSKILDKVKIGENMSRANQNRTSGNNRKSQGGARKSGGRYAQESRYGAQQRTRKNTRRRRKKQAPDYRIIALVGVALMFIITGVLWVSKNKQTDSSPEVAATTETTEAELEKTVTVDGVSINGMSSAEAKTALMDHYGWDMKIICEGEEQSYEVANLLEPAVDALLQEIYQGDPKETYTLEVGNIEEAAKAQAAEAAKLWDVQPKNAAIAGFDKETGKFQYSQETSGKAVDQEKLAKDIQAAVSAGTYSASLTASVSTTAPEITAAQAKEMYQVIGTMTTKTTSNKDRNTNIQIAASALDGLIIQPGAEFSFNQTTGNRTTEKGYKPAGAYVNGVLVEEPGGGVCQVSSTLYNAVVFSGLKTTERHAHSYEPSYITPGEDAMVSYDGYAGPDMKFINNSKDAVAIRAKFADQQLTISIVGIPILESNERWYMKSEKVAELDPPAPNYEENQTLEPGVEKVVKNAVNGSRWVTNLVKEKDGKVVSDELLHKSTYKGKPATIQRNTSGVVVLPSDAATESSSAAESVPESTTAPPVTETETAPTSETVIGPGAGLDAPTESSEVVQSAGPGENGAQPGEIAPHPLS